MNNAPAPSHRLIPSRFPPIGLFDTVTIAADLPAVLALVGWTNDRLVQNRINRLPRDEWVFGRPNASVVMASFLHVAPGGMRFNGPDLGAWYAAASLTSAIVEVAHHLRREALARRQAAASRSYREYQATLLGGYGDLRGQAKARPDIYHSTDYHAAQAFGETVRASNSAGIIYDSVRHASGTNIVAYRPRNITDIIQVGHFVIRVQAAQPQIEVRRQTA